MITAADGAALTKDKANFAIMTTVWFLGKTMAEPCFNCGTLSTQVCRLNDELEIDTDRDLRPVCDACGPNWNIGQALGDNTFLITPDYGIEEGLIG